MGALVLFTRRFARRLNWITTQFIYAFLRWPLPVRFLTSILLGWMAFYFAFSPTPKAEVESRIVAILLAIFSFLVLTQAVDETRRRWLKKS